MTRIKSNEEIMKANDDAYFFLKNVLSFFKIWNNFELPTQSHFIITVTLLNYLLQQWNGGNSGDNVLILGAVGQELSTKNRSTEWCKKWTTKASS